MNIDKNKIGISIDILKGRFAKAGDRSSFNPK